MLIGPQPLRVQTRDLEASGTSSVKGYMVNTFGIAQKSGPTTQLCECTRKAVPDNNAYGHVPAKLYSQTLKSEFHRIFMCHKIVLISVFFFEPTS